MAKNKLWGFLLSKPPLF